MELKLSARNIELTEALRDHIDRHIQFALARFGQRVVRVAVQVNDSEGSAFDQDKECRIEVELSPCGFVAVEDTDANLFAAIDRATDRAGRAVAREIERQRDLEPLSAIPPGAR